MRSSRRMLLTMLLTCLSLTFSVSAGPNNETTEIEELCASLHDIHEHLQVQKAKKELDEIDAIRFHWCGPNAPVGFAKRNKQLDKQDDGLLSNKSTESQDTRSNAILWIILFLVVVTMIMVVLGGLFVRAHVQTLIATINAREDNVIMIREP